VTALSDALGSIRKALDAKGIRYRLEAKQLYHDREEVTILLARKG
jgi:23S rRNA (cytidine2498-2'-O)-methyltransferase